MIGSRGVHTLKSVSKSFNAVWDGSKRHEVRRFDRAFVAGDSVLLFEFWPDGPRWGSRVILAEITNLTAPESFGLPAHLCCFTLGHVVTLFGAMPHDPAGPPRPASEALDTLPPDILRAWASYTPMDAPLSSPLKGVPAR